MATRSPRGCGCGRLWSRRATRRQGSVSNCWRRFEQSMVQCAHGWKTLFSMLSLRIWSTARVQRVLPGHHLSSTDPLRCDYLTAYGNLAMLIFCREFRSHADNPHRDARISMQRSRRVRSMVWNSIMAIGTNTYGSSSTSVHARTAILSFSVKPSLPRNSRILPN
ncbi:hypothetical protein F4780DRAFT_301396 [Xylariomycetidae sp. FL0641]|nr:hypothetical protein F4780DRAFT_301396 [Xylariomycetidae sp. FL0641]